MARREGRFALANGGTIFLDEVGELPLELQPKLLRVIQEGEFEPLGGTRTVKVDVRVLAATNRDLKRMSAEGKFREDLYFRLHVFPIHIPPLRERGADVEHLAAAFVRRFVRRLGKRIGPLNDEHFKRLRSYDWPGNVRELQNVIERAIILTSGPELQLERAMAGFTASPLAGNRVAVPAAEDNIRVLTVSRVGGVRAIQHHSRVGVLRLAHFRRERRGAVAGDPAQHLELPDEGPQDPAPGSLSARGAGPPTLSRGPGSRNPASPEIPRPLTTEGALRKCLIIRLLSLLAWVGTDPAKEFR